MILQADMVNFIKTAPPSHAETGTVASRAETGEATAGTDPGRFQAVLDNALEQGDREKLKEVCNEFETIFLNMIYKQMRSSVGRSTLFPKDTGEEIYQSMLDEELMKKASIRGGIGLARMMYDNLEKKL